MRGLLFALAIGATLLAVCSLRSQTAPRQGAARGGERARAAGPTLFFTGSDDGYLEPCGCDDGLLGGLPRRHTLLQILGAERDDALLLSNGRLVTGSTAIDAMKFDTLLVAMSTLGYDAIALTERELALGRERLAEMAQFLGEECPWLATNLEDAAADEGAALTPLAAKRALVREIAGGETLVVALVAPGRAPLYRAADPGVRISDPAAAVRAEIERRPGAAKVIALAQMSIEEAGELARAVPRLDLVIVQGPEEEDHPAHSPVDVGTTSIVTTGRKGKFLGTFRFGGPGELDEYRAEAVVEELDKSPDVRELVDRLYRDRLLDEKPIEALFERRRTPGGAVYAGAEEGSCASCHPKAWEIWAASKHAHAWKTLVDQDLPPAPGDRKSRLKHAIWDPDCVRCHVTGFGEVSGYAGLEKEALRRDAPLVNVWLENAGVSIASDAV